MIKRIKEKLSEMDYVELWCDYIRPAVLGLAGAMIGIAISIAVGLLWQQPGNDNCPVKHCTGSNGCQIT